MGMNWPRPPIGSEAVVACANAGEISIGTPQKRLGNAAKATEAADYTHPWPSCKCNPRNNLAADMGVWRGFRKRKQSVSVPAVMARKKTTRKLAKKPAVSNPNDAVLERIARALERLAPPPTETAALTEADAFVW